MKKVLYALILMLCLAGGLGVGIIRQRAKNTGDALVMNTPAESEMVPAEGEATPEESPSEVAEGEATPEETPAEETSTAVAEATPEPTPEEIAAANTGRNFGGGSDPVPVKSGKKRGSSSSSTASSSWSDPGSSGSSSSSSSSVPFNTEVETSVGTVIEDPTPVPAGKKGKKSTPEPTPEAVAATETVPFDSVDDLPTVDTGSSGGDDWGSTDNTTTAAAAATPDPFAGSGGGGTEVAMLPPSGPSELNFPSGSPGRASLKKVTQTKRGAETVVKIQMSGSARYRVFRVRNPSRIYVDFEETEVPGGAPSPIGGTTQLVKEISAKPIRNAGGLEIARVQILLNSSPDKLPNVTPSGSGEASGSIEIVIGGQDSF